MTWANETGNEVTKLTLVVAELQVVEVQTEVVFNNFQLVTSHLHMATDATLQQFSHDSHHQGVVLHRICDKIILCKLCSLLWAHVLVGEVDVHYVLAEQLATLQGLRVEGEGLLEVIGRLEPLLLGVRPPSSSGWGRSTRKGLFTLPQSSVGFCDSLVVISVWVAIIH